MIGMTSAMFFHLIFHLIFLRLEGSAREIEWKIR